MRPPVSVGDRVTTGFPAATYTGLDPLGEELVPALSAE
jgi:hypothetical protein